MDTESANVMVLLPAGNRDATWALRFRQEGYNVHEARPTEPLPLLVEKLAIDLVVIDLPDGTATDHGLIRRLRANKRLGIALLVTGDDSADRILGLENGVDFYLRKPFVERELLLRARNLLQRILEQPKAVSDPDLKSLGEWKLDVNSRRLVTPQGASVWLSAVELDLLMALVEQPRKVVDRRSLMLRVKHRDWQPHDRYIDVIVSQIRRKLGELRSPRQLIRSVYGGGYMFNPE